MPRLSSTVLRRKLPIALLFLCAGVCATALAVRSRAARTSSPRPSAQSVGPRREPITAEMVTLRPTGFEPAEITRPTGRFLLAVNNASGLEDVSFRLERDGRQFHVARLSRQKGNWRQVLELAPGDYTLSAVDHPDWVCRLTVTR